MVGEAYVEGAPDLLVEILSPSNWLYDRREKIQAYQEAGVAEYWIGDPRALAIDI
jgi:Uma2 family endonuclease